ncbi:MAG: GGDEF domain-containing protein [Acidiferrobacterales bacterium]
MNQNNSPEDIKKDIAQLKAQIRHNERIWLGFRDIEVTIIGARSLHELIALLVNGIHDTFSGVDCVTLAYHDRDYSMARLLAKESKPELGTTSFITVSRPSLEALFPNFPRPHMGRCNAAMQSLLFPSYEHPLGSMVLVPLILRGQLIGSLNQASRHPTHYDDDVATDFLEHLAAISAMCIDNVINREQVKQGGLTDVLTGVANRGFFERRLQEELTRWNRRGGSLVCMLAAIDDFKQVNDEHGHHTGDCVLQHVAELFGRQLRASDVLARYGGEEFALLLSETSEKQAQTIAERLRDIVAHARVDTDSAQALAITLSIGLTVLDRRSRPPGDGAADSLLVRAHKALSRAKQTGRNKVVVVS